jgi:toll-interacting protein
MYIEVYDECAFSIDERIAWGMIEIPTRVLEGELADDWYPLSGRQGDEKEGVVNLLLEYRVCF